MRFPLIALLFCGLAFSQAPQQTKVPDDKVVAEVDHKKYTAREVRELKAGLPQQYQPMFDVNPATGKILLQTEGFEIDFRRFEIAPASK